MGHACVLGKVVRHELGLACPRGGGYLASARRQRLTQISQQFRVARLPA
jgi:hypothetical protein